MPQLTPSDWWMPLGPVDRSLAKRVARTRKITHDDWEKLAATGLPVQRWGFSLDEAEWTAYVPPAFREFILAEVADDRDDG